MAKLRRKHVTLTCEGLMEANTEIETSPSRLISGDLLRTTAELYDYGRADVANSVEGLKGKIETETCDADLWAPIEVKGKGEKVGWDPSKCNAQTVRGFPGVYLNGMRVKCVYSKTHTHVYVQLTGESVRT